jgi:hypothetical protein
VSRERREPWPFFPEKCRSNHPWRPGTVTIYWEPCDCPAAQSARGGHIVVQCQVAGCYERWMRPLHRWTFVQEPNYR